MENLVLVRVLVTYPSPHDMEREETSWHKFYDHSPEFLDTNQVLESYKDLPGVEIKVWYTDPDEKVEFKASHSGPLTTQ